MTFADTEGLKFGLDFNYDLAPTLLLRMQKDMTAKS